MTAKEIVLLIPEGRENAISRAELKRLTGFSDDRKIRELIKQANKVLAFGGKAIISSSGARGYWITENLEEMESYLEESSRRSKTQYQNDNPIRQLVQRKGGAAAVHVTDYFRRVSKSTPEVEGQIGLEV